MLRKSQSDQFLAFPQPKTLRQESGLKGAPTPGLKARYSYTNDQEDHLRCNPLVKFSLDARVGL